MTDPAAPAPAPPKGATLKQIVILLTVIVAVSGLFFGSFGSSSVCGRCGAIRHKQEMQVPFTRLTYFSWTREEPSPVADVLAKQGWPGKHGHVWLFASGGGNGTTCALGPGHIIRPQLESPKAAALVTCLFQYADEDVRDGFLRAVLDPKSGTPMDEVIAAFPATPFSGKAGLDAWLSENQVWSSARPAEQAP